MVSELMKTSKILLLVATSSDVALDKLSCLVTCKTAVIHESPTVILR